MTKKDKKRSQNPNQSTDFFSDISQDLRMEVEGFSEESEEKSTDNEEQPQHSSQLFSEPESETFSHADEASLFDESSGKLPPQTDASVKNAVPYPAALSEIALENAGDTSHQSHTETPSPDLQNSSANEQEHNELQAKETQEWNKTESPQADVETIEFGERVVSEEQKQSSEEHKSQDETIEKTETVEPTESNETSESSEPTTEEASEEPTEEPAEVSEEPAEEPTEEASEEPTEEPVEASEEPVEASEEPAEASEEPAEVSEEPAEVSEEPNVVVVQQGERSKEETPSDANIGKAEKPFRSSQAGTILTAGTQEYRLEEAIEHAPDRVVWKAYKQEDEGQVEVLIRECSPSRYRTGYQHFPDIPKLEMHRPFEIIEQEERVFLVYEKLEGVLLADVLRAPDQHWTIGQLRQLIRTLAQNIHAIHQEGYLFLQLDAQHIWLRTDRTPLLWDIERLPNDRTPFHLRPISEGFSAPELYHPQEPVGKHSDIFSLGLLLHYLISQCPAFNHLDLPNPSIPSPRVYQLDFPVGLDHVIENATHLDLNRRYANIPEFINSFERALKEIEERHQQPNTPLQLSVGHDIHIGINKGLRNPVNQDALFWRYDRRRNKGLFLVADGVSHCHYGSGDRASSILIQAARQCWDTLVESPLMDTPTDYRQRRSILNSIFAAANQAISNEVNQLYERVEGYVEDVMGSTCIGGFLDGNQMTITNLGDSRAYLKTDHYIEQINIDHDYKTAQLQVGQDMRSLQNLMGGSLITRCVGSCRKDEALKVVPLQLQADFFELTLLPGDIIILCSDGLTDYAGETEEEAREMISKIVEVHTEPISACFWLTALANQRGGGDNISVIEIKVIDTL